MYVKKKLYDQTKVAIRKYQSAGSLQSHKMASKTLFSQSQLSQIEEVFIAKGWSRPDEGNKNINKRRINEESWKKMKRENGVDRDGNWRKCYKCFRDCGHGKKKCDCAASQHLLPTCPRAKSEGSSKEGGVSKETEAQSSVQTPNSQALFSTLDIGSENTFVVTEVCHGGSGPDNKSDSDIQGGEEDNGDGLEACVGGLAVLLVAHGHHGGNHSISNHDDEHSGGSRGEEEAKGGELEDHEGCLAALVVVHGEEGPHDDHEGGSDDEQYQEEMHGVEQQLEDLGGTLARCDEGPHCGDGPDNEHAGARSDEEETGSVGLENRESALAALPNKHDCTLYRTIRVGVWCGSLCLSRSR